jgi:hypothetical protein
VVATNMSRMMVEDRMDGRWSDTREKSQKGGRESDQGEVPPTDGSMTALMSGSVTTSQ